MQGRTTALQQPRHDLVVSGATIHRVEAAKRPEIGGAPELEATGEAVEEAVDGRVVRIPHFTHDRVGRETVVGRGGPEAIDVGELRGCVGVHRLHEDLQRVVAHGVVGVGVHPIPAASGFESAVPRSIDRLARSPDVADVRIFPPEFLHDGPLALLGTAVHHDHLHLGKDRLPREVLQAGADEALGVAGRHDNGDERFGLAFAIDDFDDGRPGRLHGLAGEEADLLAETLGLVSLELGLEVVVIHKFRIGLQATLADIFRAVVSRRRVDALNHEARRLQGAPERRGSEVGVVVEGVEPIPVLALVRRTGGLEVRHDAAIHPAGLQGIDHLLQGRGRFGQMLQHMVHRHHAEAVRSDAGVLQLRLDHGNPQGLVGVADASAGQLDAPGLKTMLAGVEEESAPAAADVKKLAAGLDEGQDLLQEIIPGQPALLGLVP